MVGGAGGSSQQMEFDGTIAFLEKLTNIRRYH